MQKSSFSGRQAENWSWFICSDRSFRTNGRSQLIPRVLILFRRRHKYTACLPRQKEHRKNKYSLFHLDNGAQNSSKAISIVFCTIRESQLFLLQRRSPGPRCALGYGINNREDFAFYHLFLLPPLCGVKVVFLNIDFNLFVLFFWSEVSIRLYDATRFKLNLLPFT